MHRHLDSIGKLNFGKVTIWLVWLFVKIIFSKSGIGGRKRNWCYRKLISSSMINFLCKKSAKILPSNNSPKNAFNFFCSSSLVPPLTIAQMAKNTQQITMWELNWSIDLTTAHKTQFLLDVTNVISDVKGTFDQEGSIFIAHADGVWQVKYNLLFF